MKASTFKSLTRAVATLQKRAMSTEVTRRPLTTSMSTSQQLPPVLSPPSPPLPEVEQPQKSFFSKLIDRYSPRSQRDRVYHSEVLFQAATRQAADPYVLLFHQEVTRRRIVSVSVLYVYT